MCIRDRLEPVAMMRRSYSALTVSPEALVACTTRLTRSTWVTVQPGVANDIDAPFPWSNFHALLANQVEQARRVQKHLALGFLLTPFNWL